MPTLPSVLLHLAERLRDNGALVSPYLLEIMAAAMSFLQVVGVELNDDVAAAAFAAALLISDDARKVVDALGVPPELVSMLEPTPIGVDHQVGHTLTQGSRSQAIVAASMLFVWYVRAAKQGKNKRMEVLRTIADRGMQRGSQNPDLARTLTEEMNKVAAIPRQAPKSADHLFSISIDLVSSTDAKTRV